MGSYGSTRWGNYRKKTAVEECLNLDIHKVSRGTIKVRAYSYHFYPWDGLRWPFEDSSFAVEVGEREDAILPIHYTVEGETLEQVIPLQSSPLLNGTRWWFSCPVCWRRTGILRLPPGAKRFACRWCHNLNYASSQEQDTRACRLWGATKTSRWLA